MGFLELRRQCGVSHEARQGAQGASHVAPGKSGLHVCGEGERVSALEFIGFRMNVCMHTACCCRSLESPRGRLAAPSPSAPSRVGVLSWVDALADIFPAPGPAVLLMALTRLDLSVCPHGQGFRASVLSVCLFLRYLLTLPCHLLETSTIYHRLCVV